MMSSKFQPIQIPPGVITNPTKNMRSSNWAEVNLVRWIEGEMQPVGGQSQYQFTTSNGAVFPGFASRCKAIHGWFDLHSVYHIAYVCETNVYVATSGVITEITPAGGWPAPPTPGEGGYGDLDYGEDDYGTPRATSSILAIDQVPDVWSVDNFGAYLLVMYSEDNRLLIWDPAATANVNDVQTLSLIGNPTGGSFTLTFGSQTTDPNNPLAFNATAANVQSALTALSNIGAGNVVCSGGPLPTPITITFQGALANMMQPTISGSNNTLSGDVGPAPSIAHTTTGANLLLSPVGGAPHGRFFCVTQERFVMIFGMTNDGTTDGGSFRRFGWCDQEDPTNWIFTSVVNQAGFLDIEPASPLITGIAGRFGVLFFTAKKAYVARYEGLPYIFGSYELADNCTPWSPASIVATSSYVLWMSEQGMFSFDGTTIMPVACYVRPWINDDVDRANVRFQACAVHVSDFNEFWWFYPQDGQPYNTRAVIYNYKEGWWSQANMARSAGISSSYTVQPVMANGTIAYQHELGVTYSPDAQLPWAETFDLNLASGVRLVTLKQVIPDLKAPCSSANAATNPNAQTDAIQSLQFQFFWKNSRSLPAPGLASNGMGQATPGQWTQPIQLRPDGYVDARVTGRDIRMRIKCVGPQILPWTVGQHLVDFALRGDR